MDFTDSIPSTSVNNYGDDLTLSLSISLPLNPRTTVPSPPPRKRRSRKQLIGPGKTEFIAPPYPWATNRRATVHTLEHLFSQGINTISGTVQCKSCKEEFLIEYDLRDKFTEVALFIMKTCKGMHDRAPSLWMNPTLPDCRFCDQRNCARPVISKKKDINWLFLFLGQMIGCCKLSELRYFCKHTKKHSTGAKDRVLYLAYVEICSQLDPSLQ